MEKRKKKREEEGKGTAKRKRWKGERWKEEEGVSKIMKDQMEE